MSNASPERLFVLADVTNERVRQISKGYTAEHDDAHSIDDLVRWAEAQYANRPAATPITREQLVKAAAVIVAAIESLDRRAT